MNPVLRPEYDAPTCQRPATAAFDFAKARKASTRRAPQGTASPSMFNVVEKGLRANVCGRSHL